MKHSIIFVGLDVHKDSVTVALADDGRDGEVRLYGSIGGDTGALDKAIRRFRRANTELRLRSWPLRLRAVSPPDQAGISL